ncbi:twin-arginine translocase subunit TatC [Paenibacillus radicis (ex Gao et al. 2016)]|uniref:Sec-independent protein translocase protein TatC n=1 Tax=Paenibacillus radicis (ex Gao et al. 2016) TaxID=1737354 RepID=A0A917HK27_9BACL|nr:twin-arginine translocase subunit TatC [Paenibacillus radicis (ex Gao et al. 2016)]GGG82213.1 Sec-independent protein translocase protein TatCy [Paenibacillus radicis (ex Gao et al. 2016)]
MGTSQREASEEPFDRERIREEGLMPLLEHLGELRKRIIYVLVIVVIGMVIGLIVADPVYTFLMNQKPANGLSLHAFSMWDGIGMYMKFSLIIALILAIPFTAFQLWAFVKPALRKNEQRATLKYIPFALFMFLLGLAFSYFVVFPLAFHFTRTVSANLNLEETIGITQYFSFMFNIIMPIALLFELPLVIMFLTAIRVLNPLRLRKLRKLAYFIMVFIGVVVTPPDFISDILVAIPLILLYEVSVFLSAMVYKKQLARDKQWEDDMEFD